MAQKYEVSAVVRVWLDGYASDNTATLIVPAGESVAVAVTKAFGSFAAVASIYVPRIAPPLISEAYARSMSAKDNS